jgi:1,4-dihydroxy-2-naphthoate octaprenyltransferase
MAARNTPISVNLLAPLPFLLAGCLPFWAGSLLAQVSGYPLRYGVLLAGTLAVAAVILAACAGREACAPEAGHYPAWRLGPFPASRVRWTGADARPTKALAYAFLGTAALMCLVLQFLWGTGDLTIPLGALGILGGYFYFAPPLAWRRRGLGEAAGALCFGLLPVATGFYLQSGYWVAEEFLYGLPLTFAAFNLLLIFEFPEPSDEPQAPRSLVGRLGPVPAALLYTVVNVLTILGLLAVLFLPPSPLPFRNAIWPLLLLAVVNQELLKRRAYQDQTRLRWLGGLSLALLLGMGAVFCLMLWQRW